MRERRERGLVERESSIKSKSKSAPRLIYNKARGWVPRKIIQMLNRLTYRVPNFRKPKIRLPNSKRGKLIVEVERF